MAFGERSDRWRGSIGTSAGRIVQARKDARGISTFLGAGIAVLYCVVGGGGGYQYPASENFVSGCACEERVWKWKVGVFVVCGVAAARRQGLPFAASSGSPSGRANETRKVLGALLWVSANVS